MERVAGVVGPGRISPTSLKQNTCLCAWQSALDMNSLTVPASVHLFDKRFTVSLQGDFW